MALIGNILWFVLGGGLVSFLLWALSGVLMALTIVGIPFAVAAWRIAGYAAFPFGRELVDARLVGGDRILGTSLANFLWVLLAGWWLSLSHILAGISCCLSIVGIPFGLGHFKLAMVCFAPLGKQSVSTDAATVARLRYAEGSL